MSAVAILTEFRRRGVSVRADGDKLFLKPKRRIDSEMWGLILRHKPEIIRLVAKGVSLNQVVAILGGTLVPEGGAPTGWAVEQWTERKPLGPGKGLGVTCQFCGNTAMNPKEGLAWAETHECSEARVCSHCHGKGKSCGCALCKVAEHCVVCGGAGRIRRNEPPFVPDSERTEVKPIPVRCVYCSEMQESAVIYARHLNACVWGPGPSRAVKVGDPPSSLSDDDQGNGDAQKNLEILEQQELDRLDAQDDLLNIPRFKPPEQWRRNRE